MQDGVRHEPISCGAGGDGCHRGPLSRVMLPALTLCRRCSMLMTMTIKCVQQPAEHSRGPQLRHQPSLLLACCVRRGDKHVLVHHGGVSLTA